MNAGSDLELSFIRILIGDVFAARARVAAEDTQSHRRETIHSTLAAIEGTSWIYREHVRDVAASMGLLTPISDLALRERTFSITDQGNIVEQVRFVTLPTIIRLATKQAQLIAPTVTMDFASAGWRDLKTAIEVRNRVTHPKSRIDLHVELAELGAAASGLAWLVDATETALAEINASFRYFIGEMRGVVDALKRGDETALSEYRTALLGDDEGG